MQLIRLIRRFLTLGVIILPLPNNIVNGTLEDAGPVMANFNWLLNQVNALALPRSINEFRLTAQNLFAPVPIADVLAATQIFAAPYKGNVISLYDGTNWNWRTSAGMTIAVPATTATVYDVFCFDNAGVPTLELQSWMSDVARTITLSQQDGVYVKSGAVTRRYLGSFRTTSVAGQTEDSLARRWVWNYYNRVVRPMRVLEGTNTWTYTTNTIRQANGSVANQLDYLIGRVEDPIFAEVHAFAANSLAATDMIVGIGMDTTAAFTSGNLMYWGPSQIAGRYMGLHSSLKFYPPLEGRHFLAWNEISAAAGVTTWGGNAGAPGTSQSGIHGEIWG
jgi:hypothetical protein